jgi:hypothetical protein
MDNLRQDEQHFVCYCSLRSKSVGKNVHGSRYDVTRKRMNVFNMCSDVTEVETRHNMGLKTVTDNTINRIQLFEQYFVPGGTCRIVGLSI